MRLNRRIAVLTALLAAFGVAPLRVAKGENDADDQEVARIAFLQGHQVHDGLVRFDMRSNISVGLPIDIVVYQTDSLAIGMQRRVEEDDIYYQMVHRQWGEGLRQVFAQLPAPDWA